MDLKKTLLNAVEDVVKKIVAEHYADLEQKVVDALKDLVPGDKYDAVVDVIRAQFAAKAKEALDALVDKIDGEVG